MLYVCVCVGVLLSPGRAGQTDPDHMEPAPLVPFVVALGLFPIRVSLEVCFFFFTFIFACVHLSAAGYADKSLKPMSF